MANKGPNPAEFDAGRNHQVSNDEGTMKVYDERGKRTTPIVGTGVTIGDKVQSEADLQALKETNPEMHAKIQQMRSRAAGSTIRTTGGGTRKVDADTTQEDTPKAAAKMGTNEAYDRVNALHGRLLEHARKIAGSRYRDGAPKPGTVATSDDALALHSDAHGKIAQAGALIKEGLEAKATKDPHYANNKFADAFKLLKHAHDSFNSSIITKATATQQNPGGVSSPIMDETMKGHSKAFTGFGPRPKSKPMKKALVDKNATVNTSKGTAQLNRGDKLDVEKSLGRVARPFSKDVREGKAEKTVGFAPGENPARPQSNTGRGMRAQGMGGGVVKNTADVSQKKFRLGPSGATPVEPGPSKSPIGPKKIRGMFPNMGPATREGLAKNAAAKKGAK